MSSQSSGGAAAPQSSANQGRFDYLFAFPAELRIEVARSAIKKPAIHFVKLEACQGKKQKNERVIKMRPLRKTMDKSVFRETHDVLEGIGKLIAKPTDVFLKPHNLQFEKLAAWIDAATDMVCVHDTDVSRALKADGSSHFPTFSRAFNESMAMSPPNVAPYMDHAVFRNSLTGIRRVGITLNVEMPCAVNGIHPIFKNHSYIWNRPLYSSELAHFLDCFPDLEAAYIIIRTNMQEDGRTSAREYCEAYLAQTQAQRDALGLEMFLGADQKYVEFSTAFDGTVPGHNGWSLQGSRMLALMEETRKIFTEQWHKLPHGYAAWHQASRTLSLERRQAVKFKVLLRSGPGFE